MWRRKLLGKGLDRLAGIAKYDRHPPLQQTFTKISCCAGSVSKRNFSSTYRLGRSNEGRSLGTSLHSRVVSGELRGDAAQSRAAKRFDRLMVVLEGYSNDALLKEWQRKMRNEEMRSNQNEEEKEFASLNAMMN